MKKWSKMLGLFFAFLLLSGGYIFGLKNEERNFFLKKNIKVQSGSAVMVIEESDTTTVEETLSKQGINLQADDEVFPGRETKIFSGMNIQIRQKKTVQVIDENEEKELRTSAGTVEEFLLEKSLYLDEDDLVSPSTETTISEGARISVTRVVVSEEVEETKIPFDTEVQKDDKLSWRKKEVVEKGEAGVLRTTIRIARHNNKEVSRKILSKEVSKKPKTEIIREGTFVKTGKSHRGGASWYAHTGTLSAANPWLPMGSYVKVTNTANGKSVIVKINDRGPFGAGRIIDLDRVAFQEIASLGTGVIDVKMEEITN